MAADWDRGRETGNPALGPGWQMTPVCRPEVPAGLAVSETEQAVVLYVGLTSL